MQMSEHAVVIAGGGPTGLMLAGELALAGADVAIVERRATQELAGSRAGGVSAVRRRRAARPLSTFNLCQTRGIATSPGAWRRVRP